MTKQWLTGEDADEQGNINFILPQFVSDLGNVDNRKRIPSGYSCAKEWTETRKGFACGCPRCLRKLGLSLTFHHEDWNESGDCQEHWRKLIVSVKTANLVTHLIVPGYEPG